LGDIGELLWTFLGQFFMLWILFTLKAENRSKMDDVLQPENHCTIVHIFYVYDNKPWFKLLMAVGVWK
jgi:hypothetical protein